MQKRRSMEGDLPFDVLIENMKIDSLVKRVEDADKRDHVTIELARKLASSVYHRKKSITTFLAFEKELYNEVLPRYGLDTAPRSILACTKLLKSLYNSNYGYLRLVAINSFNALLDQFITTDNIFPKNDIKSHFYKILLISIYISGQSLPVTNNIHIICTWICGCIHGKSDNDIKYEVEKFIKDPVPLSNGKLKRVVLDLYEKDISGRDFLRMIRYSEIYRSANKPGNRDFTIPNDILILTQEYKDLMEKFKDRYRYYMDTSSDETMNEIDGFLNRNKIKL